jgi:tetratricopeptide (TPR) repeat protein
MNHFSLRQISRKPPVVLASLLVVAVLAFWGVNRLVVRFGEQRKALARHLYERSREEQQSGSADAAIEDLRAALGYDPDNFQYQLSLARLLRDSGPRRQGEAESYLISLWERDPQNGAVNLAIARLFARQGKVEKAIQYYHNAIFGVWGTDEQSERRDARIELVRFLLGKGAYSQAQAELISWSSVLPPDPDVELTVANLFAAAHDYEHALGEYQKVLHAQRDNAAALAGAGNAAYQLGRYRTAEGYLQAAVRANPSDSSAKQMLQISTIILQSDPYARRIKTTERNRRVKEAFAQAGRRLQTCATSKGVDLKAKAAAGSHLASLEQQWLELRPGITRLGGATSGDTRDSAMDLVSEIEQETQAECGPPAGLDQALLLLGQNPAGVDR